MKRPRSTDLSFDQNGRIYRFDYLDREFCLGNILFEGKAGAIENDFVEPCLGRFNRLRHRMSVVCVYENRLTILVSHASNQRSGLPDAEKCAFPFRYANYHRQVQGASACRNRIERHHVGEIKMTNCDSVTFRLLQEIFKRVHKTTLYAQMTYWARHPATILSD